MISPSHLSVSVTDVEPVKRLIEAAVAMRRYYRDNPDAGDAIDSVIPDGHPLKVLSDEYYAALDVIAPESAPVPTP